MSKPQKYPSMTSQRITEILKSQHSDDVFVPECKDGPTWGGGHARMDVWVMNRSWTRLCFTAYEIKVSRNDFKQDNKWHSYLPLCNQLYFVCPKGMIGVEEVPDGVGLKYCTESRALTVKKAAHREVVPPMELFCYMLMCRSRIVPARHFEPDDHQTRLEKYREWIAQKIEDRHIGDILRFEVSRTIDHIRLENVALKKRVEAAEQVEKFCRSLGINRWDGEEQIKKKIEQFQSVVPEKVKDAIRHAKSAIAELEQQIL